jgi:transposase
MDDETRREQASPEVQARIRASFERQGLMRHLGARIVHIAVGPGDNKGCGNRSTVCCTSRNGLGRAERPRPARPSWTARVSRPPNGGPHGYDGAKRLNGRKRHLLVDTLGLVCKAQVTAADIGDRDGAMALLRSLDRRRFPRLRHGWVDGGYRGPFLGWAHQRRASPSRSCYATTADGSGAGFRPARAHRSCRRSRWSHAGG